jgi:hypothetical protein
MVAARFVNVEGLETPCLLVCRDANYPEEIDSAPRDVDSRKGPVTYRLQPSTADTPEPVYVEVFQE